MWVDGFNYRYYAGRKADGGREIFASVIVSENNREIYAQLTVAESAPSRTRWWTPPRWQRPRRDRPHRALRHLFDTDKAMLKPESRPTLDQIAKLLTGQPQLNVFIVGHTDSQGAYDYNLDLSRRRAEAVAAELVKNFRIAQARLRTAGVGFLAPVGSNASDSGRALNRRVELVAALGAALSPSA